MGADLSSAFWRDLKGKNLEPGRLELDTEETHQAS